MSRRAPHHAFLTIALAGVCGLSALVFGVMTISAKAWFMAGFEGVVLVSGVVGVVMGVQLLRRKAGAGFDLGLACLGGTIAGASFLGVVGTDRSFLGWFGSPLVRAALANFTLEVDPLLLGRLVAGGLLAGLAAWLVLMRSPRASLTRLATGLVLGVMFVALAGIGWKSRGSIAQMPSTVQAAVAVFGFLLLTGLFAASVHFQIRAFGGGEATERRRDEAT